jgi:hypothetical protein
VRCGTLAQARIVALLGAANPVLCTGAAVVRAGYGIRDDSVFESKQAGLAQVWWVPWASECALVSEADGHNSRCGRGDAARSDALPGQPKLHGDDEVAAAGIDGLLPDTITADR